ncbi:serine protease [Aliiglaciecola sp. CAU 1673]|uniref:S1 family peptidase n=1 Tax=Aliiglaciecola sp. CAU 1673 TaxID=3032595 RepID=UPI0023DA7F8A|nr:serine protease [Aliiglaciecola sp. CAU 1673]MDF2176734.1 serine protease [Aliiglaciecola sp. CAU 1673]
MKNLVHLSLLSALLNIGSVWADQTTEFVSGINTLTHTTSGQVQEFVGNGFLLSYKDMLYGVTVKHSLFEVKLPAPKSTDIAPHIESWVLSPRSMPTKSVKFGQLLNADANEVLDMKTLEKDYLLFSINGPAEALRPLTLRETPVEIGEELTAIGCTYLSAEDCQNDRYTGTFKGYSEHNLRIHFDGVDMSKLRGLSGSPVLDKQGKVVGIVSNVLPAEDGEGMDFAPARLDYLLNILSARG